MWLLDSFELEKHPMHEEFYNQYHYYYYYCSALFIVGCNRGHSDTDSDSLTLNDMCHCALFNKEYKWGEMHSCGNFFFFLVP